MTKSKSKDKIDKEFSRQSSGILKDKNLKTTKVMKINIVNDTFVPGYSSKVKI